MNRFFTIAATAALIYSGMLTASEDIADLQARLATLEAKMMAPAASGDAESLMSLQKKGNVKIGGKVEINLFTMHRDEVGVSNNAKTRAAVVAGSMPVGSLVNSDDQFNYTTYNWEGSLNFQVDINANTKAVINLDLENGDGRNAVGDLVDEIYIEFSKVRGSNWDAIVGKKAVPYGQAYTPSISTPYVDGGGLVMNDYNRVNTGKTVGNPHFFAGYSMSDLVADTGGEAVGVYGKYNYKDILTFEVGSFMGNYNNASEGVGQAENMHNDKSDKWFGDYSMRLTYTPTEALTTSVSFLNLHEDWEASNAVGALPASQQQQGVDARALSLAFTYDAKAINTLFFGEYVANWNVAPSLDQADIFQLGATYVLTPKILLTGWYEMMAVDNLSTTKSTRWSTPVRNALAMGEINEDAQRFGMAAGYTTDSGVQFNVEYIYEYYQNDLTWYQDVDCHQIAFQTVYTF